MQGSLMGVLSVMKGTPTTYNKDFQVSVQAVCKRTLWPSAMGSSAAASRTQFCTGCSGC
jgi:argininosuccinate lyase